MDPITVTIMMNGGEPARILGPVDVKPYNPNQSGDYTPNAPDGLDVIGVPETRIELIDGATAAYTMQATQRPAILAAKKSRLEWNGETWTILKVRDRRWKGRINGFTLFLAT